MSLFNLLANTVEGVAQVTISAVKLPIGAVAVVLDGGNTLDDAEAGIKKGLKKIGDAKSQDNDTTED